MKKFTSLAKKIICLMLCLTIIATPIIQDPAGSDLPGAGGEKPGWDIELVRR